MNLLSAITLQVIFTAPTVHQAGSYFSFQPVIGIFVTVIIGLVQWTLFFPLARSVWGRKFLSQKYQFVASLALAIAFTTALTVVVSTVNVTLPY